MAFNFRALLTDVASALVKEGLRSLDRSGRSRPTSNRPADGGQQTRSSRGSRGQSQPTIAYPGDFTGEPPISYHPEPGDHPDPGEVVWGWVPYEEDHSQGKDRPVLLIGEADGWLLALPLTSQDHDRDAAQEASQGRFWVDIGSGAWDRKGRPSEARVDRVVRIAPSSVRRTGAALGEEIFRQVANEVRRHAR